MSLPELLLEKIGSGLLPYEITEGDDLNTRPGQKNASVLVPIVMRKQPNIILTKRPDTMREHAGQIAFPGGKREEGESALDAALRETHEEIGIVARDINIIGRLPSFNAASNYRITPFVGIIDPNANIIADSREVDDVFEVRLDYLMNSANHIARDVTYKDKKFTIFDMPYKSLDGKVRNIWGMTAMIIYRLYQRSFLKVFETDY